MPSPYSSKHDEWKDKMDKALKESEQCSPLTGRRLYPSYDFNSNCSWVEDNLYSSPENDFLNGFLKGKTKTNGCVQHTTIKPSKFNDTVLKKPFSGNDFLDGFASTQTKRDEFLQQTTKSSKSNDSSGCRKFLDEQRKLKKSRSTAGQSPSQEYTRKPPIASTQTKRDEFLQQTTTSSKSNDSSGCREFLDEQRCLRRNSRSTDQSLSQFTRKPITASIKTPSPSTYDPCMRTSTTTIRPTSYECLKISEAEWQEIEEKSQQEQKIFLGKYLKEGKFKDVPVSCREMNVRRGDHLFCQGALGGLYDHHFLCTDVDVDDRIHVIEYTGPSVGFSASSRSAAESNPLAFATIKQGTMTYEELEKKKEIALMTEDACRTATIICRERVEAKIREWPEELQRFPVDEVISRAELRLGKKERDYHAFENNCEHFVNWCKCGLNTSLQVEPWYKPAWDSTKAVGSAALQGLQRYGISKGVPAFLKAVGNVSDEILGAISSHLSAAGYAVGAVIETGFAAWNIFKDYKRMKEGRISKRQFQINSVATASKATGHITCGIAGSVIGSVYSPVGSLVGGAIGYGVGHLVGSAVGLCYEYAPKIKKPFQEKVIAPVKKVVNTCVNAVKTAGREVWEGVKSVFSSLFSWW